MEERKGPSHAKGYDGGRTTFDPVKLENPPIVTIKSRVTFGQTWQSMNKSYVCIRFASISFKTNYNVKSSSLQYKFLVLYKNSFY